MKRLMTAYRDRDVAYLIDALVEPDSLLRTITIKYLWELNARESIPKLIQLLRAEDRDVKIAASKALGRLGAREALEELERLVDGDRWTAVRGWALGAIAEIDEETGREIAMRYWIDESWRMRTEVMSVLEQVGNLDAVALLDEAAASETSRGRRFVYHQYSRKIRRRLRRKSTP